jgi:hypothetical protein
MGSDFYFDNSEVSQLISLCWDSINDMISGSLGKGFPFALIATAYL